MLPRDVELVSEWTGVKSFQRCNGVDTTLYTNIHCSCSNCMKPSNRHCWTHFVTPCTVDQSASHLCQQGSNLHHYHQLPQPQVSIISGLCCSETVDGKKIGSNWPAVEIEWRDFKPIHYRSISSAYRWAANRVMRLQDNVAWRHAGVERHGYIVHQCAVAVIDENAATLPSGVSRGVFWLPENPPPGHDFFN